jgi:hypothetical protein
MMSSAPYGHIIKHLETSHLDALPIPVVRDDIAADFYKRTQEILDLRNRAHRLTLEAEERFTAAIKRVTQTITKQALRFGPLIFSFGVGVLKHVSMLPPLLR